MQITKSIITPRPALTYKRDFDHNAREKQNKKIKINNTVFIAGVKEKLQTSSREVRVFTEKMVEELCFTRECVNYAANDLSIDNGEFITEFTKILAPNPKTK